MGSIEAKVKEVLEHPENDSLVREVFEALDKDGNKTLDREEYAIFVKLVLGHDAGVLKQELRDRLGVLSGSIVGLGVEKIKDQMLQDDIENTLNNVFGLADSNQDGVISYDEFLSYLFSHLKDRSKSTLGIDASQIEMVVAEEK